MKNNRLNLEKIVPPGISPKSQIQFFITGNIISFIISLYFFVNFYNEIIDLYEFDGAKKTLIQGIKMPDFPLILDRLTLGFALVAICMLFYVIYYYGSYKNGSMSIYLMKRLPSKFEMHKRALTLPLITAALSLIIGLLVSIIYLGLYVLFTPVECLKPDQWQKFWLFFSYFI